MIRRLEVDITTDGTGAFTGYSTPIAGLFIAAYFDDIDLATTADIAITEEQSNQALLTLANQTSDGRWMPRAPLHDPSGAAISGAQGAAPVGGRIKVVIAQGGAAKTGILYLYVDTGDHP